MNPPPLPQVHHRFETLLSAAGLWWFRHIVSAVSGALPGFAILASDAGFTRLDPQHAYITFVAIQAGLLLWHLVTCAIHEAPRSERMLGTFKLWGAAFIGFGLSAAFIFAAESVRTSPNHAPQRTGSAVTAPAEDHHHLSSHQQVPRPLRLSLSLGSLGA